jgi:hypothetical protein
MSIQTILETERVKPHVKTTPNGILYVFLYALSHRVYVVNDNVATFLYDRPNANLAAYSC